MSSQGCCPASTKSLGEQSFVSPEGNNGSVFGGRLYINEGPASDALVFDAMTGETVGTFDKDAMVAFHAGRGFFASGSTLEARSIPSMTSSWKLAASDTIAATPIVVNGRVYIAGTSGTITAIDEQSGALVWSQDLNLGPSVGFAGDKESPRSALGAGGGALVVPWGNRLVALWRAGIGRGPLKIRSTPPLVQA